MMMIQPRAAAAIMEEKSLQRNLVRQELDEAEQKAWESLGRYKFMMAGYWMAIWVHLNRVGCFGLANPFAELVQLARKKRRAT